MDPQKILTAKIDNYRISRDAGKIQILTHTDTYGNITGAVEQKIRDRFTDEITIFVAAPISVEGLNEVIERMKTNLAKGNPDVHDDVGLEAIKNNIESLTKQIQTWEKKLTEREKMFNDEIANVEAMRDDIAEALEKAKKEREQTVEAATEAAQKVVDENKSEKKK